MAGRKRRSRRILTVAAIVLVAAALAAAFWPRPEMVDIGQVERRAMRVTIDEEGRTQVHDAYVVSTPVAGRLLRVQVHPGQQVKAHETMVAQMRPTNPAALDIRTREQARAAVSAAEAALRLAQADHNAAIASAELAEAELERTSRLTQRGTASQAALDRTRTEARAARAQLDTTEAAIAMREAELANARAQLIGFDDQGLAQAIGAGVGDQFPLFAPVDGRILRIIQESETTLPAGTPVMEIGDVEGDLEVVVDLISSDAVQVEAGDRVLIDDWGGPDILEGEVLSVDPFGQTRYSALGVEEQRVKVTVGFTGPAEDRRNLGHGYRVQVRIVVWEAQDTLAVPASALFRVGEGWAVFRVEAGTARQVPVGIGHNNGVTAQVTDGLEVGEAVILYPSAAIADGVAVAQRTAG